MSSDDGEDILGKVASILLRPDDETFKCSYRRVEGQLLFGGGDDDAGRRDREGGDDDSDDSNAARAVCVRAKVSKLCLNNTVRPAWEGQLVDVRDVPRDDLPSFARNALPPPGGADVGTANRSAASALSSPSRPPSGGLAFSLMTGDAVNALHRRMEELRAKNAELEGNTLRWKSTAERLGSKWEDEKGERRRAS